MYTHKILLHLFLTFSTNLLFAQGTKTVNGIVKDSIGNPVESASVTVINESGAGIFFTKTDKLGFFNTIIQRNKESLFLKITSIGYNQFIVPISTVSNYPYVIILIKADNRLLEVTVKSKSKISLSNDTIKYNVSALKEKHDQVIADLIARLPGIQVDDKGIISYNGKSINNIYIDGDNLLDGKYRTATNNIPISNVEEVQVIEKDQPIKALNGYVTTNNISLNLKLTDSARLISVNTGFIGLGNKAYTAELNNFTFKKRIKSINNIKANNIGYNLQSEQANIGISSNNGEIGLKTPRSYLSIMSEISPTVSEKYHLINNDNAMSVNTLYKLKFDWTLRLNVSALQFKRYYKYNHSANYFLPNADTIRYDEIQNTIEKTNHWQITTQIEKNSNFIYLKSITRLELPKWDRSSSTTQNSLLFKQLQPTNHQAVSNETSVIKAIGVNNILQYNSVVQYYKTNENLRISSGIQKNIINDSIEYSILNQQVGTESLFINQSTIYKTKFNSFILSTALGAYYEHNTLNTNLYKIDSSHLVSLVGNHFINDIVLENLGLYGKTAFAYQLARGMLSIETTPTISYIKYNALESLKQTYFLFNPIIDFHNKLGKYSELNFRYSQQTSFGQINDIYQGIILISYRQFSSNDTPLPKTDLHTIGARYSYRKPINMFFYFISLNYDRTKQNFINSYIIDSGVTKAIAINYKNATHKFALTGNISKYLFSISTNISANGYVELQRGNSFYNNAISPFNSYNINLSLTARKKISSNIMMSISGNLGEFINEQNTLDGILMKNITKLKKLKAEWQHNLSDQISYTLAYNFTSYNQELRLVNNNFLDLNLKYSPIKWRSFFELQCINLINQNLYQQILSTSNQISIFQLPLRSRTVLLKYSFTF